MPDLYAILRRLRLKNKRTPIKNSSPIRIRAMKGATCQLIKPMSTKVYSKGSIGYSLAYPEKTKTTPNREQIKTSAAFFNIMDEKKAFLINPERFLGKKIYNYFNSQVDVYT